ncbi:MAG: hypothetical protein ABS43_20420 [Bordetella sp. SCN 67-23]|nr:tripartite tricarboxylate transporter substrate binding protein [Burkholderiales bacterium]ODS71588.1 MAG: hypothetical protein ABS43_20420 [Bordetella sp. SCN 67-23]ODU79609.1 MAG: hypothetical protein ABT00_12715 [Bordetella sp. SCN 68-11]OJW86385.1 MAG: hypothetical protein BGO71_14020 [Burkholderiales bacterium 67-32]
MKIAIALVAALCAMSSGFAHAQAWPRKNVRVIVPYGPGSVPDTLARLIFENVQKTSGQVVVVENRAGAAGMIGAGAVARAEPDGYTLVLAPAGPLATNALLYKKMPYDPLRDLAPVAMVAETPTVLVASTAVHAGRAADLLVAMRDPSRRMAYASPGNGTLGHLAMAYLVALSGGDVPHAPYAGSPQIVSALIANDVQMAVLPPLAVAPFIKSGKIDAVAIVGPRRTPMLAQIPTLKEQGIDFDPIGWFGLAAPAATPPAVLQAIHAAVAAALRDPKVVDYYRSQGMDPADLGPAAFSDYIARELDRWRPIIARNAISLD